MFSVIFEVQPKSSQFDAYLGNAKMLKPELEQVEGFVENIRYKCLTRPGWILSLSSWRDEKSVVRWRTRMKHHAVQEKGRSEIFSDYHLRVGQVTHDTRVPQGLQLEEQRLDETEVGEGTAITLIDIAKRDTEVPDNADPLALATWLGLNQSAQRLVAWDVYEAVLTPGDLILLLSWKDKFAAAHYGAEVRLHHGARLRHVRIVRDYGMYDRREAPQYYPEM